MVQTKTLAATENRTQALKDFLDEIKDWVEKTDAISIQIDCKGKSISVAPRPVFHITVE